MRVSHRGDAVAKPRVLWDPPLLVYSFTAIFGLPRLASVALAAAGVGHFCLWGSLVLGRLRLGAKWFLLLDCVLFWSAFDWGVVALLLPPCVCVVVLWWRFGMECKGGVCF